MGASDPPWKLLVLSWLALSLGMFTAFALTPGEPASEPAAEDVSEPIEPMSAETQVGTQAASRTENTTEDPDPSPKTRIFERDGHLRTGACANAVVYQGCFQQTGEGNASFQFDVGAVETVNITLNWTPTSPANEQLRVSFRSSGVAYSWTARSNGSVEIDQAFAGPLHQIEVWTDGTWGAGGQLYVDQPIDLRVAFTLADGQATG